MDAFALLARTEGIIPAIESAHAVAGALKLGRELGPDAVILINLSGRGDKDMGTAAEVVQPWAKDSADSTQAPANPPAGEPRGAAPGNGHQSNGSAQ